MKMSGFLKDEKRLSLGYIGLRGGRDERGADSDEPDGNGAIADSSSCYRSPTEAEEGGRADECNGSTREALGKTWVTFLMRQFAPLIFMVD
jgi:hypothetical protein